LAGATPLQNDAGKTASSVKSTEILSYEGQDVSAVELAGRPDLNVAEFNAHGSATRGEPFSAAKIDEGIARSSEPAGSRISSSTSAPNRMGCRHLHSATCRLLRNVPIPRCGQFPYARLLQVSNYSAQEPYMTCGCRKKLRHRWKTTSGVTDIFEAQVEPDVRTDNTKRLAERQLSREAGPAG